MSDQRAELFRRIKVNLLPTPGQGDSPANFYLNFLIAVTQSLGSYTPKEIHITSAGEYFTIQAVGSRLAFSENAFRTFPEIFDIANRENNPYPEDAYNILQGFHFLSPIVYAAEYCLVDIPTEKGLYRQAFFQGRPLGEPMLMPRPVSKEDVLGFFFTLPTDVDVFEDTRMDVSSLKETLLYWRKAILPRFIPKGVKVPKFRTKWRVQSTYHHSLQINFQYEQIPSQAMGELS